MRLGNGEFTHMTKFDEDLGQALKECRKAKGITQKQVADYFGITKMAVSYWESGINAMTAEQLKRYCKFLGVSVQYILGKT
jgi:transcriptional regulator with XRE-family HTH domain